MLSARRSARAACAAMFTAAVLVCLLVGAAHAVDRSKFKTCDQAGFCHRLRAHNAEAISTNPADAGASAGAWQIEAASLHFAAAPSSSSPAAAHELTASLHHTRYTQQPPLSLRVELLANGVVRTRVVESFEGRFSPPDVLQAAGIAPLGAAHIHSAFAHDNATHEVSVTFDASNPADAAASAAASGSGSAAGVSVRRLVLRIAVAPRAFAMRVEDAATGAVVIAVNERNLFQFEQHRLKHPTPEGFDPLTSAGPLDYPYDVPSSWEESFGSHSDSKPRGPTGVAMDFSFPHSQHVYGLPEHASSLALKNTIGAGAEYTQPYRLYNLDVFEFELNEPMSLYGAIPFLFSHTPTADAAVFWLNSAETFVDISSAHDAAGAPRKDTHFISESGQLDFFLMVGRAPADIFAQYAALTGRGRLPQMFAIAYHQCRWNYKDDGDVRAVDGGFDEHDIPYDVLWLDIEHTDGKRYFTWDKALFPDPAAMQNALSAKGRKMVTIIDPHIKKDSGYGVYQQAHEKGSFFVQTKSGAEFDGWCWPGSSAYLDFAVAAVRQYWASLFALDKYLGSTPSLYTWNDMNEPSVFNGPETTMQKDNLHLGGTVEHRDIHNMYGFYQHMATAEGQLLRSGGVDRPFVLSRSFFAGSQRHGPIWTGDNLANWEHLASSLPMLMSLNIAGYSFVGADVGGFFKDPEPELLVRWYQAGAYQPFFRGHAHIDTKRREPWLFGDDKTQMIRAAIRTRYSLLPYLYTCFHSAATALALPVMRPLWVAYPTETHLFGLEDQHLLGGDLLIKPVTRPGQTETHVVLPGTQPWYDVDTAQSYAGSQTVSIATPIGKIPVFQRGGSIIARKERVRRSSHLMAADPFTLVVALDSKGAASGHLYLDDGHSHAFATGQHATRAFEINHTKSHVLRAFAAATAATAAGTQAASSLGGGALLSAPHLVGETLAQPTAPTFALPNVIERIVLLVGAGAIPPRRVVLQVSGEAEARELEFSLQRNRLIVRKPDVNILADFTITFE